MPFYSKYTGPLRTAARKKLSAVALAVDAYFNYVTLLLSGDGTNAAQNNTFVDGSTNNYSITRTGNTTQGSFSPYGSNWSNNFNGTDATLNFPSSNNFAFGTGSFTIEFWINGPLNNDKFILGGRDAIGGMHITTGGSSSTAGVLRYVGTSTIVSSNVITDNTWHHCAIVRNGSSNITLYVDGVSVGTGTDTNNYAAASGTWYIARNDLGGSNYLNGYLSNLRIVKGTAVYTSSFTPSTTPLTAISGTSLLTCQSNRFIDNSATPVTITTSGSPSVQRFNPFGTSTAYSTSVIGGSGYFDGGGDYLTTSGRGGFVNNTTFTIEFWTYPVSYASNVNWINSSDTNSFYIETFSGTLYVGDGAQNNISATPPTLNAWTHVALAFNGTTYRLYYNGVQQNTSTTLLNGTTFTGFRIGAKSDASRPFYGYISDVRILVGTNLYPNGTTFTPPTAPLTAITNTAVLLNYTNGAIFDNAMMNDLETVGNAQISTSVYKYGTGSLYFDGNGDNLSGPANPNLDMNTGNWTIECWVYVSSRTLNYPLIFGNNNGSYSAGALAITNSNSDSGSYNDKFFLAFYDVGTFVASGPTNSLNTWYHLAVVRNGTNISMYRNGESVISTTISAGITFDWGKLGSRVGGGNWDGAQSYFNGYIDDLRVTKGVARYTTTFTPPTTALGAISAP
jgi:hypothetical protein